MEVGNKNLAPSLSFSKLILLEEEVQSDDAQGGRMQFVYKPQE